METMYCKTISAGNSLECLDLNLEDVGADKTPRALSPRKTAEQNTAGVTRWPAGRTCWLSALFYTEVSPRADLQHPS